MRRAAPGRSVGAAPSSCVCVLGKKGSLVVVPLLSMQLLDRVVLRRRPIAGIDKSGLAPWSIGDFELSRKAPTVSVTFVDELNPS